MDRLGQLRLRFAELRLVRDGDRVQVYGGKDFAGYEVSVAVLTERAEADQGLRQAFAAAAGRARGAGDAGLQADVHAAVPWLAVRHPEGQAAVQRLLAELDRYRPAPPAGMVWLAPLPVDAPPPPVWPDPAFAPTPPPIDLQPAAPAPLTPARPPAPQPSPPPAPRPAPRQRPARSARRRPASYADRRLSRSTMLTLLVVVLLGLAVCGQALVAMLLG